ncbi:oligosaccharide repeat unit polymerase [Bacteroides gallinarum]|nr:oligosaccharide repeat unit polymerase [Bacteroides gallinarum]
MIRGKKQKKERVIIINKNELNKLYNHSFILGLLGVMFRYTDLFLYRNLSLQSSTIDNRSLAEAGSGNMLSIVSSLLIFCTYIPITIDLLCPHLNTKWQKWISLILFFLTGVSALTTGSRFAIIIPLTYYCIILMYSNKVKFKVNIKNMSLIVGIVSIVLFIIGALFLKRVNDMKIDPMYYISIKAGQGFTNKVPINQQYKNLITQSKEEWYFTHLYAFANITQYESHAIFEFPIVKDYIDKKGEYFYGSATFFVITKFICKILGIKYNISEEIRLNNARPGIWSTFFFTWYLDFGWVGILLMFFVGMYAKYVWAKVYYSLNFLYIPLLCLLTITWLVILQLNYISGSGTYALFTFTLLPFLYKINSQCISSE